ncbi:hypothetical protein SMD44_p10066 (plasmid) [Streptomyces alboflavus]|uniref:Uncharacterized protein n=1 Tax=Streptomyces alboflavus TaxID=67267 RepID=A0A291W363_9ACTN|nr:glutathione synthetase [Streptomyces alboflavus]ATM24565.1 hypothetical protein SMD44_p10066 [Streptomyces alboflavus]
MALAAPAPAAAPPAHRIGTAAVVAPSDAGDLYLPALARHGWNSVAVTTPTAPQTRDGYLQHITHRTSLRRTAAHLANLGVQAVIAGSPAGTELADRLADRLNLPGNAADTADIRRDTGFITAALLDAGITAPRSIRTTRLNDALNWAAITQISGFVLQHTDPAHPHPGLFCRTDADIVHAWHRLQHPAHNQPLVLREHLSGARFRIHTLTGPGANGTTEHAITSIWSQTHDSNRQVSRTDLLSRRGLLARALALYTMRALTALGVNYGPAHAEVAFVPDRGPALLSLRTDPYADFASDVLRRATGHDSIRDTVLLLTSGRRYDIPQHRSVQVAKVTLLPQHDGTLDPSLLRTITTLPTVATTTDLRAGSPVRAGQAAGQLLLVASDSRAVNQDYQVIRAVENLGLYRGPA